MGKGVVILFFLFVIIWFGCERDYSFRGGSEGVWYSNDTITFDTVFSSIGSATKNLRLYNFYNDDLTIDRIGLAGGDNSKFRININGISQSEVFDVRIRSNDSIFVFVEVTIDPAGVNIPFVVRDSLVVETQYSTQYVQLVAYGQDVIILDSEILNTQTFTNEKPYLIYNYVVIDTFQQLRIEAGARLHFHNDASMLVFGSLIAEGTVDDPIIFEGDRLEEFYDDIPGQWGFIHFFPGSKNNIINHSIIRNGIMGVRADSIGLGDDAPMIISNSRFEHISSIGLLAENSRIKVINSLFADCAAHSVALTCGGDYEFYHCTIARMYTVGFRSNTSALLINNYYTDSNKHEYIVPLSKVLFGNCIIYGTDYSSIEIDLKELIDDSTVSSSNYYFDHCLIKTGYDFDISDKTHFNAIIENEEPGFMKWDVGEWIYDVRLDTLSIVKDAGSIDYANIVPVDASGIDRLKDKAPDLGMYERVEFE
ncbi:MAG: right-handed parallel beta-helix repeat-containing protein [Marinilabiliaceae bacterium]|nr:right-handed parallel beta-helix repeat-containing protein [Marinilabiliaceae bacterium]